MKIKSGSTNVSVYYYIVQDASGTSPGEPVTGLLFSDIETGGSASYARQGAARVDLELITLASASASHADGGFILVDDTNTPGLYRCDYPDAAFVTGVDQTFCQIVIASAKNAIAAPILVDIDDNVDQTANNDTKLTTLLARIIGTLATGIHNPASAAEIATLSDWIDGGRLDLIQDIIAADTATDIPALIANLKDFDPANDAVAVVTLVNTLTTYTLNTPQTADNDILLNAIAGFIDTEITDIINTLGVAGAGLTDLGGMSAGMKGEVNAECDQALIDYDAATGTEIAELNNITSASVLAAGDVDGFTLEESLKLILAASVGVLAGAATSSITIQAADGSKTRITATVDEDGNRSAVVKDVTG